MPQGIDFHCLARPRCDHEVAAFGIHPGQLHAGVTPCDQVVPVDFDTMSGAALVPGNDIAQQGQLLFSDEFLVAGGLVVAIKRISPPEGGVGGVVLRSLASVWEVIGQHAFAQVLAESGQNAAGFLVPAGGQAKPAQANHGIAAPV